MIKDILTGMNAYVDGRNYAGRIAELELPKLVAKMREYIAGGMAAAVDIPTGQLEKMESTLNFHGVHRDIVTSFGVTLGAVVPFVFRGATQDDDGTKGAVTVTMRGLLKELDWGSWKSGEDMPLKASMALHYYRYEYNGETLIEVDPINNKVVIDGVDQLADMRAALGL